MTVHHSGTLFSTINFKVVPLGEYIPLPALRLVMECFLEFLFSWMCLAPPAVKSSSFNLIFILGNREKAHRAKSGKYDRWGTNGVLFLTRNYCTMAVVYDLVLSWWRNQSSLHHFSTHFLLIDSLSCVRTSWQNTALTGWPGQINSLCTIPSMSQKRISIDLTYSPHLSHFLWMR